MVDEAHGEAFFAGLDEVDGVLLVAKAIAPELQSKAAWLEVAARVVRGQSKDPLPPEFRGRELDRRLRGFVERGWVQSQMDTWRLQYVMDPERAWLVLRAAHRAGRLEADAARAFGTRRVSVYGWDLLRQARVQLALGCVGEAMASVSMPEFVSVARGSKQWPVDLLGLNPEREWLESAPDEVLVSYAKGVGLRCTDELRALPTGLVETVLEVLAPRRLTATKRFPVELLRGGVLSQDAARSEAWTRVRGKAIGASLTLLHAFAQGELGRCFSVGAALLESHPAQVRGLVALCMLLACVDAARCGQEGAWLRFDDVLGQARGRSPQHEDALELLGGFRDVETGVSTVASLAGELGEVFRGRPHLPWTTGLVGGLLTRWMPVDEPEELQVCVAAHARSAEALRSTLIPQTFAALACRSGSSSSQVSLLQAYAPRAAWEHVVEQLEALAERLAPQAGGRPAIHWDVLGAADAPTVAPRLVRSAQAVQGRAISIAELVGKHVGLADEHDVAIAHAWLRARELSELSGGVGAASGRAVGPDAAALLAMVGHPRVRGGDGRALVVVRGTPRVVVDGDPRGARIFVEPEALRASPVAVEWETSSRLVVYPTDEPTEAVLEALGGTPDGRVPQVALERLLPVLPRLAGQVSLQARGTFDLEDKHVDPKTDLEVDLEWRSPMLHLLIQCWPLGRGGPRCTPAEGPAEIVAHADRSLRTTTRDLEGERAALEALLEACPRLQALDTADDGALLAYGVESACRALGELTLEAKAGTVTLAWPRGKPLRLSREYDVRDINISVRRDKGHWLRIEADLQVDEGEVSTWRLLGAEREGSGRFVPLADGQVLRLSESLRRKLDALGHLRDARAARDGAEGVLLPEVALPALEGLLGEDGGLSFAGELRQRRADIEDALSSRPRTPRGLRATLRGYQREGFVWMSRLARAGLGGVLADDMGLGKTVQTLAVLLERKKQGPALVVCPTSVVANWCAEATRFAPSMRVVDVGTIPRAQREPTLRSLGPGTLAVLSYGLLSRFEGDPLEVATLVFDEAHALKNASSARTQAAASIVADVRFGLTGTPIENHLGELWSVFNSCVPGLMGDEDVFRRTTARAVAAGDAAAASRLRALVRPFLLRRTKDMVLTELPERSETLVMVEPSTRERAWYEAQRQLAQERLGASKDVRGRSRIKILAEISRLRRAAVEPRLVDETAPRGAKLDLVVDRARELVAAGHQVLVFTQFLGVLAILGELLRKRGVRVLELQGSTPGPERARRIDAFQAGDADVFLMSLKAGGVGVNLTAADYVIHVDPWWNPAVEDQATGRAHRMGQTRPVTVYRYCTVGSIEPKILALHGEKRELAQDVLGGMSTARALDLDELTALMR
ncbi:MAG: DEAD/DEAH box helicase [Nannocystales bacterium]